jgi:hypothetical protein
MVKNMSLDEERLHTLPERSYPISLPNGYSQPRNGYLRNRKDW